MAKLIYSLLAIITLASCADSFKIDGTSNVSTLDGRMLYLKVLKDNNFKSIDSCDVVHGHFSFAGTLDTIRMGSLFMDDESVLPLVLESGDISIKLDNTQQTVSGTPLNDKLFKFFSRYNQIKNQQSELVHLHDQAIMDGRDMNRVNAHLAEQQQRLLRQEDKLVTNFVCDNFDNILGPGVFFMMTVGYQYPELTPWIEDIMSRATQHFKSDPYVKDYYEKAQENEEIMNGMKDAPAAPPANAPQPDNAPTPNEMAQPAAQPAQP